MTCDLGGVPRWDFNSEDGQRQDEKRVACESQFVGKENGDDYISYTVPPGGFRALKEVRFQKSG
jgi:hypothetical protein